MKKLISLTLVIVIVFSLASCGKTKTRSSSKISETTSLQPTETKATFNTPDEALEEISNDFSNVTDYLLQQLDETFDAVGTTYKEYSL